jgi:hypothetical protein
VDANTISANGLHFDSSVENERGALLLLNNTLYVPYGGHYGDCGSFHGWVIAVPVNNPSAATGWATQAREGGIWAPSGVASDGTSVFAVTGNTGGTSTWGHGESVLKLSSSLAFSGQNSDYFAPTNWLDLDNADLDLGGSGTILFSAPGATPSTLALALGKDGYAYLLNRSNLGGISNSLSKLRVSSTRILSASTAYTTANGTYVVFNNNGPTGCPNGTSGNLMALKVSAANPPALSVAWCASQNGKGAPITTTTDGSSQAIVWSVGAEGDNKLKGFDGDTGQVIFNGGGSAEQMSGVQHFQTVIEAKERIFVPSNGKIFAFAL